MEAGKVDAAKVLIYRDEAGEWRWSARDTNGERVADSGEGYVDKAWAEKAATDLFPAATVLIDIGEATP